MHLQDAYFAEKGDVGTGTQIAYTAPAKNVFEYNTETAGTFSAKSQQPLDVCAQGSEWKIVGQKGSKTVTYTPTDPCPTLTPNFSNIGKGS